MKMGRKSPGYWEDFSNVERELRAFIKDHGRSSVMPTNEDLRKAGRSDLTGAIRKHGGYLLVAEHLELIIPYKPRGFWENLDNFKRELLTYIKEQGTPGIMPTHKDLRSAGRNDLRGAIQKYGGYPQVAARLGLASAYERNSLGYWADPANMQSAIFSFIEQHGTLGVMPTQRELRKTGQGHLDKIIQKHGGYLQVATRLGLALAYEKKLSGHWDDFDNVAREVLAFNEKHGHPGVMPTHEELRNAGRADLTMPIQKHGGYPRVAARLGLTIVQKPKGFWDDGANVERAVRTFIEEHGTPGIMPTHEDLRKVGQNTLRAAIRKHGGIAQVAARLGLTIAQKPKGHWEDFDNIKREVLAFNEKHGHPGVMPTQQELRQPGRGGLPNAIGKHGGFAQVASRLGLELPYTAQPPGYWDDFSNIKGAVLTFVEAHGTPGMMPTYTELLKEGRSDLIGPIRKHGGNAAVASRLGLIHTGRVRMTANTASSVEKIARAIQPLAESNLLNGAQIMLILRRAGLLEFRNRRIIRLSLSLVRGDHDEIETAIAEIATASEEIGTETIAVESEHLIAAEVESQISSGEEASEGSTLASLLPAPTAPDTQREQGVIRGLSALGELRLPLDEILSLVTCKVLWEAFYRRLYGWYGSLDAAQNITAEDVEASILSAYPDHTDNEFVATASALFAVEVEQAVYLAASLQNYGWHGPHLRLHQADAARRMAAVLGEQDSEYSFLLNADDPGMGKSAAFLAAVCISGIRRVIIVAPKTVADDTWTGIRGEIRRCLPHARIVRGLDQALSTVPSLQITFFILHYEELLNEDSVAALAEQSFDCLCLDEIHFIKQRAGRESTHRRTALEILRDRAHTAIGLTGTPLINELAEPMSILQTLSQNAPQFDHARLSNRRISDIADVFEALLPHVIRRRKREVLLHLPGCDVQTVDIPVPQDLEEEMLDICKWPKSKATYALIELRKLSINAKLPYLLQRSQAAHKLLILAYLTDDVSEKIFAYLEDFLPHQIAHINGRTPRVERQKWLDSFRAPDGVRVLVGTIGTIGVGLTLFDADSNELANEIIVSDLPYTWAEFEQGIARLYREGQRQRVRVDVLQTTTSATLHDGSALHTLDERIWTLIEGKRELSDVAIDGKYDTTDASTKVQKALRRWLQYAREIGVEPLLVERRPTEQTEAQKWRNEIGRLRILSAARADEVFADPEYTRQFLAHLQTSAAAKLSHQWLRGKLMLLLRPDLTVVDMGCGLNPFVGLPCQLIGLDRHDHPEQPDSTYVRGKMEAPPLPDKSADVLIYSLSLYGTSSDLLAYFTHASRILRGGGHLFIVEPTSAFTPVGLACFLDGLSQFGFELVGNVRDLRGEDVTLLKGMHLTLTGEMGKPEETSFVRK